MTKEQEYIDRINARENIEFVQWDGEFKNSKSKAVVRCQIDGYEWSAVISKLVSGPRTGCPMCSGNTISTGDDVVKIIDALPGIMFAGWVGEFKGFKSVIVAQCRKCGNTWQSKACYLKSGSGCPHCAGVAKITADDAVAKINRRDDLKFVKWESEYKNAKSKAIVRCVFDNFEWSASVNKLTTRNPTGCPQCSGARKLTAGEYIDRINARENIEFVRWDGDFRNGNSVAVVRCLVDSYEWSTSAANLTRKSPTGCPYCARYGKTEEQVAPNITVEIPTDVKPAFDLLNW